VVICWGEILWDRFPDGARLGGAPANVAYHLAALGEPVALISRVGIDRDGDHAAALLEGAGVDVSAIQRDPDRSTGEVGVDIGPGGDARYTLHPGRAWEVIEVDAAAAAKLAGARALCFGSLAQRTAAGHAAHLEAISALPAGARVVLDVNLRRGFDAWDRLARCLELATVIKINDVEAERLAAQFGVADAVDWLLADPRTELVALTRGPRGCSLLAPGGAAADHPGFAAEPGGDNVGCGDAFVAALVAGLLAGDALAAIAERANRHASRVASMRGATPLAAVAASDA
jgi:fructokinase